MLQRKQSVIGAFVVFAISWVVYLLTLEPSASYWDCPEFITCAYGLQVGHAPGAPVFMLLGRLFSLFAFGDTTKVALLINALSATASALTIMLLFLIIVWFVQKYLSSTHNHLGDRQKSWLIFISALIGSLAYAFSDSFWFSAVEGEVYATSSLFSALVFWAILKWEQTADSEKQNRWILLIFYLLGLSVGIHLLNILALPAMALVYYFKKYPVSVKGIMLTLAISLAMVVAFIFVLIPGVAKTAAFTDMIFVNKLGAPVYLGALFFVALLALALWMTNRHFQRRRKVVLQLVILSLSVWLIGYSSFAMLVIRSASNPFVDMNNVENIFGLVDYLNREQYPSRPLFKGNNYNSPIIDIKDRYTYTLYNGKYYKDELNPKYIYEPATLTFFPRMASLEAGHVEAYKSWVDVQGRKVRIEGNDGKPTTIIVPTLGDNLSFFIRYQMGHMYFRYLLWNFAGRQNDFQGLGGTMYGNWISGIPAIDNLRLGKQSSLPDHIKNHPSRNTYFLLPLLLGLFGAFVHFRTNRRNFLILMLLFIFTGIAIVFYLNEVPITPRERDYVYVGSFLAFCIWIAIGTAEILRKVAHRWPSPVGIASLAVLVLLSVPGLMLWQNFDDHNRSGRRLVPDYARNTLDVCAPNAMLFTTADNDTYPIWYCQEVEGYRKDVRQVLLPFINMGWYANQLEQPFDGKPIIETDYKGSDFLMGQNRYLPIVNKIDSSIDLKEAFAFVHSNDARSKLQTNDGQKINYLPGKHFKFTVDKKAFLASCEYAQNMADSLPDAIYFTIGNKHLQRDEMVILDILAKNNWVKPVYFMYPHLLDGIGLGGYLHPEGNVYRLYPFKNKLPADVNQQHLMAQYRLFTKTFRTGNAQCPDVYLDYHNRRSISSLGYRSAFARLAIDLADIGEHQKAIEVMDKCLEIFPAAKIPFTAFDTNMVEAYLRAGAKEQAIELMQLISRQSEQVLDFLAQTKNLKQEGQHSEIGTALYTLRQLAVLCQTYNLPEITEQAKLFSDYYKLFHKG